MKYFKYVLLSLLFFAPLKLLAYYPGTGDLVKINGSSAVYYIDNGFRYSFPFQRIYTEYFDYDFSKVKTVSKEDLATFQLRGNILLPDQTLIKTSSQNNVYEVVNGQAGWVTLDRVKALRGDNWESFIIDVPDVFFMEYQMPTNSLQIIQEIEPQYVEPTPVYPAEPLDSDLDGVFDSLDLDPFTPYNFIDRVYEMVDSWSGNEFDFRIGVSLDYYNMYKNIFPHDISDRNNLRSFITIGDPTIDYIAGEFLKVDRDENCVLCLVLDFVQDIDYIDDFTTGYDEYPKYPLETLMDEGGDCEDTSFLMAAILEKIGFDTVLINPPGHMAVGVAGDFEGTYYNYNRKRYFYLETTGKYYGIGDLPEQYEGMSVNIYPID